MTYRNNPEELQFQRVGRFLVRALRLRCPNCGESALFQGWIKLRAGCNGCGFRYDRGEHDHFLGAYLVNFIVAELLVVAALVGGMILTWPDVPWTALTWALALLVVPTPFATYPFARAVWLALDLHFQPERPGDFVAVKPEAGEIRDRENPHHARPSTGV
jgi:uncharacterized protein (DUF983 family)